MKKFILFFVLFFAGFFTFAQQPNDFYVTLLTSPKADSLLVQIAVPLHQNLSGERIEITIGEKVDTLSRSVFQVSARFPLTQESNLQTYLYCLPFRMKTGVPYQITLNNQKLCNAGAFHIEHTFHPESVCTFSYALPGYKQLRTIARKKG